MRYRRILLTSFYVLAATACLHADANTPVPAGKTHDLRNLIAQALNQNTDLAVQDQPLKIAFVQISDQTGIKIEIDPASVELLPYGPETRVSAKVKGIPLKEGLRQLISPIGMTFQVLEDKVLVRATPVLLRIGRQATWDELALIDELSKKPFAGVVDHLSIQFQVNTITNPHADLLAKAKNVGQGSAAEVLDIATRALGWTWYPWDRQIVVITREQQAMRLLDKRYTLNYRRQNIGQIILELTDLAGLTVKFDSGVLDKLPAETRESFSLVAENYSVRQALELICGTTGLEYHLKGETITIAAGAPLVGEEAAARSRNDPYVGRVKVPGKSGQYEFEFFLRESDLPPDLNLVRKDKIKQAVETMRKDLSP